MNWFIKPYDHWTPLDEELAEKVMGWQLVSLQDPAWREHWPFWPRETRMRLAWYSEDPTDGCCRVETAPGTGPDGKWEPQWIPRFTSDKNEAFKMVEHWRQKGASVEISAGSDGRWLCRVHGPDGSYADGEDDKVEMAIARGLLEAASQRGDGA